MTKIITWNGTPSTSIPGLVIGPITRSIIGSPRGTELTVPGLPGFVSFPQPLGHRRISAECFIQADTFQERRDRFELLSDWLDVQRESKLEINDTPGTFYQAILGDSGEAEEWRNVGTFDLEWKTQPYAFENAPTVRSWTSGVDTTESFSPALKTLLRPVIEVKPTNGTLTAFTMVVNGQTITYDTLISDGNTVTINSIGSVVSTGVSTDVDLVGAFNPANVSMAGLNGIFPLLTPDPTNTVRFTKNSGTATAIDIKVTYRKMLRK